MRPSNASKNDDLKLDVKPNVGIIQIPYSRPCVRGDHICRYQKNSTHCDFYSRPCVRGDDSIGRLYAVGVITISTHAPA